MPRVLIVVQGGPYTLDSTHEAVMSSCPVVLVADSGGVASMLHKFLTSARDPSSPYHREGLLPDKIGDKKPNERQIEMLQDILDKEMERLDQGLEALISSFEFHEGSGKTELDLHILNAIISDTSRPEDRLKLAVEWNRVDVVEKVLSRDFLHEGGGGTSSSSSSGKGSGGVTMSKTDIRNAMGDALQSAIEHRRVPIVKVLLKAAGQFSEQSFEIRIDFVSLYEVCATASKQAPTMPSTLSHTLSTPLPYHTPPSYYLPPPPGRLPRDPQRDLRLLQIIRASTTLRGGSTLDR